MTECPKPEILYPCTCYRNNITCSGNQNINLKHTFLQLSQQLAVGKKNFNHFYLNNTAITELEENTFFDITFEGITIERAEKLNLINTYAFGDTNSILKNFEIISSPIINSLPNHDFFLMLSLMKNIERIHIFETDILEIPSYAFRPIEGYQNKLKILDISGHKLRELGNYPFYDLNSLTKLRLSLSSIDYIPSNAFNFRTDSKESLDIYLDYYLFDGNYSDIEKNALLNIERPTTLYAFRKDSDFYVIQFLDEKIFSPFFDMNENNRIIFNKSIVTVDGKYVENIWLNCNDCRSYWILKNRKYLERIEGLACINDISLLDNNNFLNCE